MTLQAIFFDFDGVLADSVDVKTDAFAALYAEHGEDVVRRVVAFHLQHGGVSRFEKIRHYETVLLGRPAGEERVRALAGRFSDLVEQAVVRSPWIVGARDCLERLHGRVPLYVVSGTPEDELRRIVAARGMADYFAGVYGSPRGKAEILAEILARHGYAPAACVMVGDAMTDHTAARTAGVPFVGVAPDGASPFPPGTTVLPDLCAFPVPARATA